MMPESIQIRAGGAELIELTKPLWEKQKTYHLGIDRLSPENYVDLSFEERAIRIQKKEHISPLCLLKIAQLITSSGIVSLPLT